MPKAFLLTNKRYNIWKQINETFRKQKLLQQLDRGRGFPDDRFTAFDNAADDIEIQFSVDTSTDYSKYTDTPSPVHDEGIKEESMVPSPAVSPSSSTTSSSTSSDESDGGYSYTTENRSTSPSMEFCHQPHISYLYDLMTTPHASSTYKDTCSIAYDHQSFYKLGSDYPRVAQLFNPLHHPIISQPVQPLPANQCSGESHVCIECGKHYSTSSNLARHRQTHRTTTDKKARKCPHCEKTYVSMPAYSMHVRTHNQGCECKYCGKKFSRPWLLQGHIRTHTGEKPFSCNQCGKSFADKSNLRAHVQTHSSEKPFTCGRCGKAFALKSYLYKHEESSCMRGQRFKH